MKTESKSAIFRPRFAFFAALLALASCSADLGPSWLTGEADETVLNEPRVVSRPADEKERAWPNLADVPESKLSFVPQAQASDLTRKLVQDRKESQEDGARIGAIELDGAHAQDDPVTHLEGEPYPVGLLTAPDQEAAIASQPFSALRP